MKVYTLKEVAELLGVTIVYLRNNITRGNLKASFIGRKYIVTEENLKEFIEKLKIN